MCIVTVNDSVDTDIIIHSQWLLPATEEVLAYDTLTYATETVGNMEQRNNLTFNPLLFHHEETYICNASVTSLKKRTVDDRIAVANHIVVYCKWFFHCVQDYKPVHFLSLLTFI